MRLIDADELKQEIEKNVDMQDLYLPIHFFDFIDNAPTVKYPFYQEAYQTGYEEGHIDGVLQGEKLYARPQGEWIEKFSGGSYYYHVCSNCRNQTLELNDYEALSKYCPHCGAWMRGDKDV